MVDLRMRPSGTSTSSTVLNPYYCRLLMNNPPYQEDVARALWSSRVYMRCSLELVSLSSSHHSHAPEAPRLGRPRTELGPRGALAPVWQVWSQLGFGGSLHMRSRSLLLRLLPDQPPIPRACFLSWAVALRSLPKVRPRRWRSRTWPLLCTQKWHPTAPKEGWSMVKIVLNKKKKKKN